MVAGKEARRFGEAKNSWLTGTAAWNMLALSQYISGVRPSYDGLTVEPRLPSHVKTAVITRKFRGVEYVINVKNINNTGSVKITADGADVEGTLVKVKPGVSKVSLDVTVG